ncbi:MAG: hypothetical protein IKN94_02420 [Salinivirgaceae bacterium]|nr:hypothetical protein [Salinivirgaceae bacterium]
MTTLRTHIAHSGITIDYEGGIAMYYKRDGNYDRYIVYAIDDMNEYVEFVMDVVTNVVSKVAVNKLQEEIINKCKKIE